MSINIFKERRSIKNYSSEQIKPEELDAILEAGTYAPTGRNRQSPMIVSIQNKEIIDRLEKENATVLGAPDSHPFYNAPTVVVVFADSTCNTGLEDASLVMGNLMNAAASIGVGSCWIHRAREVFSSEYGKELMKEWGLDEKYVGVGHCLLGYALSTPTVRPRKENYIIKI